MAPQKPAGKGKVARRDKEVRKPVYGEKVLLIDMSGQDKFCAQTGAKLPKKGMVVRLNGQLYQNWSASERAHNSSS